MAGQEHEHLIPLKVYFAVFAALILLTVATASIAYVDLGGAFNSVVALAIAVTKMMLVVLFFMHVKYSSGMTRIVLFAGVFWLAILVTLTLADELTRGWTPGGAAWNPSVLLPLLFHLR
ncbi:MAG TPA: cytochrome C oxidase subunit IV family protein [Candidatus Cybelea sp.]|nr:cytochrome C oxidase subunit IV family protein [Candidatus Cybelea sp.]